MQVGRGQVGHVRVESTGRLYRHAFTDALNTSTLLIASNCAAKVSDGREGLRFVLGCSG